MNWEKIPFLEAVDDQTSYGHKIHQRDFCVSGKIPIVDQGQQYIAGYSDDSSLVWRKKLPVVIFGDHTKIFKYVDFPFILGADGVKVLVPRDGLNAKFAYYIFRSIKIPSRGYSRHFRFLKNISVPVPPLSEQNRIIAVLDAVEELRRLREQADKRTKDLIPALFHEMFGDPTTNLKGWPQKPLSDVSEIRSGGTPSKEQPAFWNGAIPWISAKDMKVLEIVDAEDHVTALALENTALKMVPAGKILIVVRGMILAHTLPLSITRVPVTINQDMKAIFPAQNTLDPEYLLWGLKASDRVLLGKVSTAGHGTRKLDIPRLTETLVPLPPLSMQRDFAARVARIRTMEAKQVESRRRLDDLFQSLLHKAVCGDL